MGLRVVVMLAVLAAAAAGQSPVSATLGFQLAPDWPELPAGWNFGEVAGIEADARGHVLVFHRGPHPLMEFEANGRFVRAWLDGQITRAHTVRVDPEGNIWVIDVGAHVVLKMNPKGRIVMVLGRQGVPGATQAAFNQPTDIAFAPNGDFYVSDGYGNSRVVKFARHGAYLLEWGRKGTGRGEFNLPHAIVLDNRGRVYVSDRENGRIQIFDPKGQFLAEWAGIGSFSGLEMTPDQRLWAAGGGRVVELDLEGRVLGSLAPSGRLPGQVSSAHGIAQGPGGEIYVAELNWRAQKFVRK